MYVGSSKRTPCFPRPVGHPDRPFRISCKGVARPGHCHCRGRKTWPIPAIDTAPNALARRSPVAETMDYAVIIKAYYTSVYHSRRSPYIRWLVNANGVRGIPCRRHARASAGFPSATGQHCRRRLARIRVAPEFGAPTFASQLAILPPTCGTADGGCFGYVDSRGEWRAYQTECTSLRR